MDTRTAFSLLGISPGASPDAIRDAYRDLAKVWHPDRFAGDARLQAKASERMRELNEAFRVASTPAGTSGTAMGAATPRAGGGASGPRAAATSAGDASWFGPFLSFDALWRSLFWAGACGVALFIFTAPEGFFAPGRGRAVVRETRPRTAEAITFTRLPESETGEATLVSSLRGTWVVAEARSRHLAASGNAARCPGRHAVVRAADRLRCLVPADRCVSSGPARRHSSGRARDRRALRVADGDAVAGAAGRQPRRDAVSGAAAGAGRGSLALGRIRRGAVAQPLTVERRCPSSSSSGRPGTERTGSTTPSSTSRPAPPGSPSRRAG